MKKWQFLAITTFLIIGSLTFAVQDRSVISVNIDALRYASSDLDIDELELLDVIGIDKSTGFADVLTTRLGQELLSNLNIDWQIIKTASDLRNDRIESEYLDYSEVTALTASYESTYPNIVKRYSLATTEESRTVWAMKISDNVSVDEDEPNVLFIGLHQAREIMSTEITMDIIDYLATNYGTDPDVTDWVSNWQIWIIPMLNPDGSAYCWSADQYWIKNRRDLGGGVYGVNLGHNYPFNWGACFGSAPDPNSNYYRGPSAASEPEIQAIINLTQEYHFAVMLSYNSFDELVLMPYGCQDEYIPEHNIAQHFGNSFASLIRKDDGSYGYNIGTWWELLYQNDGNETDYFYAEHGCLSYAIEVNAESYYPDYSMRDQTVFRNRAGWQKILDLFESGIVIHGYITDACTDDPLEAEYYFSDYPPTENETPRRSDPVTGRYEAIGRPGNMTLNVRAEGYIERGISISFNNSPIEMDIEMIPVTEPGLFIWANLVDDSSSGDGDYQLDPGETAELDVCLLAPGLPVTGITGVLSTSDPYITVLDNTAAWPDLPTGGAAWTEGNIFQISANGATPEGHVAVLTVTFDANEELCTDTDQTTVAVQSYMYMCPYYEEPLDTNPGYYIDNTGSNGWEFGDPTSGPGSGHTGTNCYATNLDGDYGNYGDFKLTSTAFDCSDLSDTELYFWQWLQNESGYDEAYVQVSNNNVNWTTLWSGYEWNSSWTEKTYDISMIADGEPTVYVRWRLTSDSIITALGFYIDDIMICGNYYGSVPPQPTPTIQPTYTSTQIPSASPVPSSTPTPPTNTPTASPSATAPPGEPTNTPITPTNTPSPNPPTSTPTAIVPTPTPTIPGQPSNTPIPTRTPEQTYTPKPTITPTAPPSEPTNTPVPPTETHPPDYFAITLLLNDDYFEAEEEFHLQCEIQRYGSTVTVEQYILLDVYGLYFFWPSWSEDLDFENHTYPDGYHETSSILQFIWPEVQGHADGLFFYAGCLYTGTTTLIGEVSMVEFGY